MIVIPRLRKCDMLGSKEGKKLFSLFQDSSFISSYTPSFSNISLRTGSVGRAADGEW